MKELLKKLAQAKSEIGAISKDSKNPFFKSAYFDINQLLEHVEPILEKNGLLLMQPIMDGKVISRIYLIESDEDEIDYVASSLDLPTITDPQKIGSCISYFRRYTLSSLLAIQAEDDDANKASKPAAKKPLALTDANIKKSINDKSQLSVLEYIRIGTYSATKEQIAELKK